MNQAGGKLAEIGRAVASLGAPTARMPLPSATELIAGGPETWETFYRTFINVDIAQFKAESVPLTISVKEGQSSTTEFTTRWNASANVGWFFFFGAGGSTDNANIQRSWEEETTEIAITFKNVGAFPIQRGQWFNGGLVREYLDEVDRSFWGPAGRLNLIPTGVVLATGVKLSIKTSQLNGSYAYDRHTVSGSAGFRIGPFSFGGSAGRTTTFESTKVSKTETGLDVEDTSGRAIVIGMVSDRPADLLAPASPSGGVAPLNVASFARPEHFSRDDKARLGEEDHAIKYLQDFYRQLEKPTVRSALR
jgi:hypothetical protein